MSATSKPVRIVRRLVVVGLLCLAAVMALCLGAAQALSSAQGTSRYLPAPAQTGSAEKVYLGFEPIEFDGVDVADETFQTSFYVWWRWRGKIDPVPTTDVLNATPSSSSYVVSYSYVGKNGQEKPTKLADGEWYQTARISTGARADFALGRYPLDQQTLDIRFENNTYDDKQLVYVPDVGHMARHPQLDVAGWGVKGSSIGAVLHRYGTDFGVVGGGAAASDYSQVVFSTHIERPVSHFLIKLFIPLLVALLATIGSLFMREDESDVRPAVAAMGLLAIVFLQQSYAGDLPATAPGVLLDQIYLAAYVVVSLTFLRTIYLVNAIHHEGNERHSYLKTTDRFVLGMVGFFLLAVLLLLFL